MRIKSKNKRENLKRVKVGEIRYLKAIILGRHKYLI